MTEAEYALALEQGSPEWLAFKVGRVGASKVSDITAKLRNGASGASRANYLGDIITERLTGVPADTYCNEAMQWGTATEPAARAAYQFERLIKVERVGCVVHPHIPMTLASPDGLIGSDGLCEIKCPHRAINHINLLRGGPIADAYLQQIMWQLGCTGRAWCDFISYHPKLPEPMQLWVKRIPRDDERIAQLESEVCAFLDDVEEALADLGSQYLMPCEAA